MEWVLSIGVVAAVLLVLWRVGVLSGGASLCVGGCWCWRDRWAGRYSYFSGLLWRRFRPAAGGYDVLAVQVKTQAGNLDLELRERDGTVLYCWTELGDASFCVDVCGKKDLIVRIEGNSYKGNFSLRLLRSQEDWEDTP